MSLIQWLDTHYIQINLAWLCILLGGVFVFSLAMAVSFSKIPRRDPNFWLGAALAIPVAPIFFVFAFIAFPFALKHLLSQYLETFAENTKRDPNRQTMSDALRSGKGQ